MESLLRGYVSGFTANPTLAGQVLRQQFEKDRQSLCRSAVPILKQCADSGGVRYLLTLLIKNDVVLKWLCDAAFFSRDEAIQLARQLSRIDPRVDSRLLEMAIAAPDDAECTATIRMLDIISETSDALRIMGKLAQLSRHKDQKVRSKAILLMGRRNKNHKWVSGFLSEADPRTRANAIESLWNVDTEGARAVLREALNDANNRVVGNAVIGLYRLGDPVSIGFMLRLMRNEDTKFQTTALWAIAESGDVRFIPVLEQFLAQANPGLHKRASQIIAGLQEKFAKLSKRPPVGLLAHGFQTDPDTGFTTLNVSALQQSRLVHNIRPTDLTLFLGSEIVENYEVREMSGSEPVALAFLIPHSIEPAASERLIDAARTALKLRRSGDEWAALRYRSTKAAFSVESDDAQDRPHTLEPGRTSTALEDAGEDLSAPPIRFSDEDNSNEDMLLGKGAQDVCAGSLAGGILALSSARPKHLKYHIIVLLDERSESRPSNSSGPLLDVIQNSRCVMHVLSREQSEFGPSLATMAGGRYHPSSSPDRFQDVIEGTYAALAGTYEVQYQTVPPSPPSSI